MHFDLEQILLVQFVLLHDLHQQLRKYRQLLAHLLNQVPVLEMQGLHFQLFRLCHSTLHERDQKHLRQQLNLQLLKFHVELILWQQVHVPYQDELQLQHLVLVEIHWNVNLERHQLLK